MMKYRKWVGAGLGWVVTGSPIGAVVGFGAGSLLDSDKAKFVNTKNTSDFEVNLLLLSASLIKSEKGVTFSELDFIRDFWKVHFGAENIEEKMNILNHFLQKEYEAKKACIDIHASTDFTFRVQIMHYLFDLAEADKPLSENERNCIFKLGCWMNINDVDFLAIEDARNPKSLTDFQILGVREDDSIEVIRTAYRKLILSYHPDKHQKSSAEYKKKLEMKVVELKEAYERIKKSRSM
jgi:DnaJ like chaperone protein